MATDDSYLKMTGDDLRAARVLTLAVKFFGSKLPIPASSIAADLYPGLDETAFNRQFLRDRELLATFGIVIHEVERDGWGSRWEVDERASYVRGDGISAQDARLLYILCHDMAFDQSFPYRDELRMALAKIARMYRSEAIPLTDSTTPAQHKILSTLVSCMSARHGASVTYTDARGNQSSRTLALYGSFGLRGHTYFVGSMADQRGAIVPDSIRTYRLDRFSKARELQSISYQIPVDFSVSDYERLPFQMGDALGEAVFVVPESPNSQVQRAMDTHGSISSDADEVLWQVPYSDAWAVASWAIAAEVTPIAPDEVCATWRAALTAAAASEPYEPSIVASQSTPAAKTRVRYGRTGSTTIARQLLALASTLTAEGEIVTADEIANTLGISYNEARHLIALVSMGSGESIDYLPVILGDEDEEVSLMEGAALSGRRIRLTRSETIALAAALSELGVSSDDPLVQALNESYASPTFSVEDVQRSLETPSSGAHGTTLRLCSQAIAEGKTLGFSYYPVTGASPSRRRVVPQMVRRSDDSWYLDAYDLVRRGTRVFRIDRMSDLELMDTPPRTSITSSNSTQKLITVRFDDLRYLELLHWHELQVLAQDDEQVVARIPQYDGMWLLRHLVACAGTVHVDDIQLAQHMKTYASKLLAM